MKSFLKREQIQQLRSKRRNARIWINKQKLLDLEGINNNPPAIISSPNPSIQQFCISKP